MCALAALLAVSSPGPPAQRKAPVMLDAFDGIAGWTASPSEGVRMDLRPDAGPSGGGALRMDFDFRGHAGWAAARKAFPRTLPGNWTIAFAIRGDAPVETLEFKLLDRSGENVWWSVRRDFEFPREWTALRYRKRQVSFAWGPAHDGELRDLGFVEITVTASAGGAGSVWLAALTLEELPAADAPLPPPRSWRSVPGGGDRQELLLDLGGRHELGGLTLDWDAADFARRYDVELSEDGRSWERARSVQASRGGRAWIALPDADAAFVRLSLAQSARGRGYRLARIRVEPPEFSETPTRFLEAVARDSRRGVWPRSLVGEQLYWAVVGVDGGAEKGLLSEDGALETGRGAFSIEPFLRVGGRLFGWADAETSQRLAGVDLPLPVVTRTLPGGLSLEVTAFAEGPREASTQRARYRVHNAGASPVRATLVLALRPVQVNPPWQFLNTPGGFAPIRRIAWDGRRISVDEARFVVPRTPGARFSASRFDDGEIVSRWADGTAPEVAEAEDPDGRAS
ncbi:MAG TPA: discoidin domain-containing protein, partial [Thermoanaerobaculia bacterium]